MKRLDLSVPQFAFVVATRAALGAGVGLLLAGRLRRHLRRRLGSALVTIGVLTTIPIGLSVFGRRHANARKIVAA